MKCHSCPHSAAIQRGDYSSKSWNELPCSSCKLGEYTLSTYFLDEENPPIPAPGFEFLHPDNHQSEMAIRDAAEPDAFFADSVTGSKKGEMLPATTLAHFVQGILSLPPELRDIVTWRYQGLTYRAIAERQGTSVQLAEMRHKRALREWPVLKFLFSEKIAKRLRRKRSLS